MSIPCRVLLVFEFSTLNGGERSLLAVLPHLQATGIEFRAICPPGDLAQALQEKQVTARELDLRDEDARPSPEICAQRLGEAIACEGLDLIHANSLSIGRLLGLLNPQLSVPTTSHLRDILKLSRRAISDLAANDRLIAVSGATADFHAQAGVPRDKTVVVPNGVVPADCKGKPQRIRDELGLLPAEKLILSVGQIGLRKGHDTLIDAFVAVASEFPEWHLAIVGEVASTKAESREYAQELRSRVQLARLERRVHWPGYRFDIPDWMAAADVLVHPARQEPFGRVLLEAAAAKLPIVATDVGGTREMLADTAILIPPNTPMALQNALRTMLRDSDLANSLANHAARRIGSFSIERCATGLLAAWDFA